MKVKLGIYEIRGQVPSECRRLIEELGLRVPPCVGVCERKMEERRLTFLDADGRARLRRVIFYCGDP